MPPIISSRAAFIDSSSSARSAVIGASDHRQRDPIRAAVPQPVQAPDQGPNRGRRPRHIGTDAPRGRLRELAGPPRRAARLDDDADSHCLLELCVGVGGTDPGACLRALHALPWGAELPRPRKQRAREGEPAAATGQPLPLPVCVEQLQPPASERRQRTEPGTDTAGAGACLGLLAVRSQPRRSELPRPRERRPHTRPRHGWSQSGLAQVRGRKPGLRSLPAAVHALEYRLQRLREGAWLMSAATCERASARPFHGLVRPSLEPF